MSETHCIVVGGGALEAAQDAYELADTLGVRTAVSLLLVAVFRLSAEIDAYGAVTGIDVRRAAVAARAALAAVDAGEFSWLANDDFRSLQWTVEIAARDVYAISDVMRGKAGPSRTVSLIADLHRGLEAMVGDLRDRRPYPEDAVEDLPF